MPSPDDDTAELPTTLPKVGAPTRFSHAAIDYSVNTHLQGLIPSAAGAVILDVKLKSVNDGKEHVLTGVAAVKVNDRWGLVLAGSLDLVNRRDYEVEILAVRS